MLLLQLWPHVFRALFLLLLVLLIAVPAEQAPLRLASELCAQLERVHVVGLGGPLVPPRGRLRDAQPDVPRLRAEEGGWRRSENRHH